MYFRFYWYNWKPFQPPQLIHSPRQQWSILQSNIVHQKHLMVVTRIPLYMHGDSQKLSKIYEIAKYNKICILSNKFSIKIISVNLLTPTLKNRQVFILTGCINLWHSLMSASGCNNNVKVFMSKLFDDDSTVRFISK